MIRVYNNTDFEGSGWSLEGNVHVTLNYGKYKPFKGGCSVVDLPKWLADKKSYNSYDFGGSEMFLLVYTPFFQPKRKRQRSN